MLKISLFLRNLQTSRAINSIILRIKNVKFSGYCFYMETNRVIFKSALVYLYSSVFLIRCITCESVLGFYNFYGAL